MSNPESPSINVDSKFVAEPIETKQGKDYTRGRKLAHSRWIITVNTNKVLYGCEEYFQEEYDKFKNALSKVFITDIGANMSRYFPIKRSGTFEPKTRGHEYNRTFFKNIKTRIGAEIGEKKRCLHAHVAVEIEHYTYIDLALLEIIKDIRREYGPGIYANRRLVPESSKERVENYIMKTLNMADAD